MDQGIHTDREIFVIRDRYTGIIWAYPSMEKFTADVINAVNHFKGLRKIKLAYADKAPEFEVAMKKLKIPFDHSLPHHPQNNSLAERNSQFIMMTTTTCLLEAGLPPCFWNHAVERASHLLNIECGEDEKGSNYVEKNFIVKRDSIWRQGLFHAKQPRKSTSETQV